MPNTWFTSDHHWGHANIIRFCERPWWKNQLHPAEPDVDAMNEALITLWNETVSPGDEVYYLGDFAMGKIKETLPIIGILHGNVHLQPGNHDRCWKGHSLKKQKGWEEKYLAAGFVTILPGQSTFGPFDTCHFPHAGGSHAEDRFSGNRPDRTGRPLIHGHVHDSWKVNGTQINVSCDVWDYKPVNYDELLALKEAM